MNSIESTQIISSQELQNNPVYIKITNEFPQSDVEGLFYDRIKLGRLGVSHRHRTLDANFNRIKNIPLLAAVFAPWIVALNNGYNNILGLFWYLFVIGATFCLLCFYNREERPKDVQFIDSVLWDLYDEISWGVGKVKNLNKATNIIAFTYISLGLVLLSSEALVMLAWNTQMEPYWIKQAIRAASMVIPVIALFWITGAFKRR